MTTETLPVISESAPVTCNRRPRGQYPKKTDQSVEAVAKRLPEYIEAHEVNVQLAIP